MTVFRLTDASLAVFGPSEVLAYSDTFEMNDDNRISKHLGAVLGRTQYWTMTGSGDTATATSGETIVVAVTPESPVLVEAETILAMSQTLTLVSTDDYKNRIAQRGVAEVAKLRFGIDLGHRRVWLVAEGDGQMIIRSSD